MLQDFSGKNLRGRNFKGQNLTGVDFSHADIRGANFSNAILTGANFSYAKGGLPTHSAVKIVIVSLFLAILSSFFSGTTGSMELAVLQTGRLAAISASFIVLTALPVFSFFTIRDGLGASLRKVAITIALAMTLPVMLAWIDLIRGSLTGATTGIMVTGAIIIGAGVLALAIAMAGLVSPVAALCVAATGALFITASTTSAIDFMGMVVTTAKGTSLEDLSADIASGNRAAPEFNVAVKAVASSVGFAGATVLMGSLVVAGLGIYLGWRILVEDEKYANLRQIAVNFAAIGGTNFQKADLTDANFTQAFLKGTDFREAILIRTCWFQCQKLPFTRLDNTYLKNPYLRKLVTTREGRKQNFDGQNLRGVNLQGSNLIEASFINTDLSYANLQQADLSRAKLVRSQLEHADLTGVILTGACIENWVISRTTKLDRIECDYIYMRQDTPDNPNPNRIPAQGNFQKDEFISQNQVSIYQAKLVIITLGNGDFSTGFPAVIAQIWSAGNILLTQFKGELPKAPEIPELYRRWQEKIYACFGVRSRMEAKLNKVTNFSNQDVVTLANQLEKQINIWLNGKEFSPIQNKLRQKLTSTDEVRVIIQSEDIQLQQLPWHLWRFIEDYPQAEIALSTSIYEKLDQKFSFKNKVRILAILGDSEEIDTETDRKFLESLPDAETVFLVEPQRQVVANQLWDEQGWDIIFFAGHSFSQADGETGKIYLNKKDSYTLDAFKFSLKKAIERGSKLAIFNSCDGLGLANQLASLHIPQIIVMREPVPDVVAQEFLKNFLTAFAGGKSFYLSVREARERLQSLEDRFPCASWLPVICQNPAEVPPTWYTLRGNSPSA